MKAEERKELETNSLAAGVQKLIDRSKTGRLVNPYVLAVVLAVALGIGLWWYLSTENAKVGSRQWADLVQLSKTGSTTTLDEFAKSNKDSAAARAARLDAARIQLGPEGIGKLNLRDRELRNKAIESVEKAREELLKLADEYKGDTTMQASCLLSAAEGELALVGVPKGDGKDSRGSVAKAAELYKKVAEVVGDKSPAAEQYKKRAEELTAKKDEIERLGDTLNRLVAPPAVFPPLPSTTTPSGPGPKLPDGPIPTPKPPEGAAPKAPATVTPPTTPPTAKAAPATPPTTPSTKK